MNPVDIRPIRTDADYQAALREIERLMSTSPINTDADRLEVLVALVEVYEDTHYPIPAPDPVEAIEYYMTSRGLTRKDLEPYIGTRVKVNEVLERKRRLSISMIRRLNAGLGISADVLIQPYRA